MEELINPIPYAAGDASRRPSISLVLPAWNEVEALPQAAQEADAALRRLVTDYEIIIVDDGSTDGTAQVAAEIAQSLPKVRLIRHETNRGYGAAIRSGIAAATGDVIALTDADCQFDLTELDRFLVLAQRHPVVCGYRIDRQDSFLRRLYSRGYNLLVRLLLNTGVRDVDCALKVFHRDALSQLQIATDGFLVNSELLTQARQRGWNVVEVGVTHRPRTLGQSTVTAAVIPHVLAELLRYWWNRVQFPQDDASSGGDLRTPGGQLCSRWAPILIAFIAAVLLLSNLSYPLIDRDETRYGEIPREMVATGNWLVPQLNYRPYFDKPPLLYWLCALSYSAFGVSEWAARLVPALSALGTLALTMWFARRRLSGRAGVLSGVALLLSVGFLAASRLLLIDGLLTLFISLALIAAYEAVRGQSISLPWWFLASLACGGAFLAKGPVALVLVVPPVAAFAWLSNGAAIPTARHWLLLAAVVAGMATPWFAAVSWQSPAFLEQFIVTHHLRRFAGAFHDRPIWYFLPVLIVAIHPWSFLPLPYAHFLFSSNDDARRRRPQTIGFLLLWSTWCVFFFSLSRCKLPSYILPSIPAFALLIGHYLDHALFRCLTGAWADYVRRRSAWSAAAATCVAGLGLCLFAVFAEFESPYVGLPLAFACIAGLVAAVVAGRRPSRPLTGWAVSATAAATLACVVLHREIPRYAAARTVFGPESAFSGVGDAYSVPVATIAHEWAETPFYLRDRLVQNFGRLGDPALHAYLSQHRRVLLVVHKDADLADLVQRPSAHVALNPIGERGRAKLVVVELTAERADVARTNRSLTHR